MRQTFQGACELCDQAFEKFRRGPNQPYRFCSQSCATTFKNGCRQKLTDIERRTRQVHATRRWEKKNPEKRLAMKRAWYQRHRAEIRAKMSPINLARARKLRQAVLDVLGGQCLRCGFIDSRALQIDHVHGGGTQERKRLKNPQSFYNKVLRDQSGYQLLCANCNWIKKHEQQEHRWKHTED